MRDSPSIYLVDEIELLSDFAWLIEVYWEQIFEEQLSGRMRDPDLWPEESTREMFLEWFDCELCTMIWDMPRTRIKSLY